MNITCPERSFKKLYHYRNKNYRKEIRQTKTRPMQLLAKPEYIEVTAPVPDYPPMNFRYKAKLHTIKKADGPDRIEQEWGCRTASTAIIILWKTK